MKSLKVIAVILLACGSAFAEAKSPYSAHLTTPMKKLKAARASTKKSSDYDAIDAVTVTGQIHGLGRFNARFAKRKNVTWSSIITKAGVDSQDTNIPTLLQGAVSVNGSWKLGRDMYPAAASVVGSKATFEFPGKVHGTRGSRQRTYRVTFKVGSDDKVTARVSGVPASASRGKTCEAHGHTQDATHAHAKTINSVTTFSNEDTARVATLSTQFDPAWYAIYGDSSNAEIAAIVNSAEAIYERQLGLRFRIVKQHGYADAASSPYTTDVAGDLLSQFLKNPGNPTVLGTNVATFDQDVDLKHLFTGGELYKDLTRTSVTTGLAFTSAFCWSPDYAYGVTKSTFLSNVTFAHEIGHNFGALHDPSDPNGIMYTYIRPNSYLSKTSVDQINAHLNSFGSCLSTEKVSANLANAKLTIKHSYISSGKTVRIQGTLKSIQGNPVKGASVTIYVGDKPVTVKTNAQGVYAHSFSRRSLNGRVAFVFAQTSKGETQTPNTLTVKRA